MKVTMFENNDDLGMLLQPTHKCCNTKVLIHVQVFGGVSPTFRS